MYRYEVLKMGSQFRSLRPYGIICYEKQGKEWTAIAVAAPFSGDYLAVSKLAQKCTELQLSPEHLIDVVSDFLFQTTTST